jgi:hypothetical protein
VQKTAWYGVIFLKACFCASIASWGHVLDQIDPSLRRSILANKPLLNKINAYMPASNGQLSQAQGRSRKDFLEWAKATIKKDDALIRFLSALRIGSSYSVVTFHNQQQGQIIKTSDFQQSFGKIKQATPEDQRIQPQNTSQNTFQSFQFPAYPVHSFSAKEALGKKHFFSGFLRPFWAHDHLSNRKRVLGNIQDGGGIIGGFDFQPWKSLVIGFIGSYARYHYVDTGISSRGTCDLMQNGLYAFTKFFNRIYAHFTALYIYESIAKQRSFRLFGRNFLAESRHPAHGGVLQLKLNYSHAINNSPFAVSPYINTIYGYIRHSRNEEKGADILNFFYSPKRFQGVMVGSGLEMSYYMPLGQWFMAPHCNFGFRKFLPLVASKQQRIGFVNSGPLFASEIIYNSFTQGFISTSLSFVKGNVSFAADYSAGFNSYLKDQQATARVVWQFGPVRQTKSNKKQDHQKTFSLLKKYPPLKIAPPSFT